MTEIVTIAYTAQGGRLSRRVLDGLRARGYTAQGYLFHAYARQEPELLPFTRANEIVRDCFRKKKALVFICAAGIAVRSVSPFVKSKRTDAPVVVLDERGQFAISLLSGHIGGANELAQLCAAVTGGVPVITTATDIEGKFAVDVFAERNGLLLPEGEMEKAKRISAAVLNGETLFVAAREVFMGAIPDGIGLAAADTDMPDGAWELLVSPYREPERAYVLQLIPRHVTLGIGCRKGVSKEQIETAVTEALQTYGLDKRSVCQVCSVDLKKDEPGLLRFCEAWGLPFAAYSAQELAAVRGSFHASEFVRAVTGVDNVCERSAASGSGGELLFPKFTGRQVTVAAAAAPVRLDFGG